MLLIALHTDTVDAFFIAATDPVVDRFGWTTFSAIVWRQVSHSVDTATGAFTTVDTMKTSRSRATLVLLQAVSNSEHNASLIEMCIQLKQFEADLTGTYTRI